MHDSNNHKNTVIKSGTLPKTGGEFTLILLLPEDIEMILTLQKSVHAALPEEEKNFILLKNRLFFEEHFSHGNPVIGILQDGMLVAQSVIVNPDKSHPKTGMTDMLLPSSPEKMTVIQGVLVHPDYRGNRLMTEMVDAWLAIAKEQGRIHAIAEVSADNPFSWAVFMKEGLKIHSIGQDPADGAVLYNMHGNVKCLIHRRTKPEFNKKSAKKPAVTCPKTDLQAQKDLLAKGYKGSSYDHANGNISFVTYRKKKQGSGP